MNDATRKTLDEQVAKGKALEAALQVAVRETVLASAYAGHPVPISVDGKVIWLQPDEVFKALGAPPPATPGGKAGAA
jgi:hypothetical protein